MSHTVRTLTRRQLVRSIAATSAASMIAPLARAQSDEVVIGQSAHLSGPLAATMGGPMRGQELALAEINRKGGIGGRKVRLVSLDDAFDAKKCVENVHRLIDQEKVTALYGLASTANVAAVLPILAEKKVPLIGVYTGSPALRAKHHPYFFTTMASYQDEVVQMLRNLATLQRTHVALLYQNSPFGQLMVPIVEEAAKEAGIELVAKASMEVSGADAVAAAQKLGEARPQAVVFMAFGPSIVPFVRAARGHIGAPIYCVSIANSKQAIAALGDEARGLAFTQLLPYPWRATTALTRDFNAAMAAADQPVDYDHFFGYANMRVLLEGMKRASKNLTSATLVSAMESMRKVDIGGYTVDFSPTNHHGSRYVEITIIGPGGRFMR